jgi:serine/threonine protein kinase
MPFNGKTKTVLYDQMATGANFDSTRWDAVSAEAKDLCARMLHVDPAQRPTMVEVMAHPWLGGMASPADSSPSATTTSEAMGAPMPSGDSGPMEQLGRREMAGAFDAINGIDADGAEDDPDAPVGDANASRHTGMPAPSAGPMMMATGAPFAAADAGNSLFSVPQFPAVVPQ